MATSKSPPGLGWWKASMPATARRCIAAMAMGMGMGTWQRFLPTSEGPGPPRCLAVKTIEGGLHMTKLFSTEELVWWQRSEPTSEELYLSGGLLVEDWPHARQVLRPSAQLFKPPQALHHLANRA